MENHINWSPFWTLQRLIGPTLFNYVGPDVNHFRSVYIREFVSDKSNGAKFSSIRNVAQEHVDTLLDPAATTAEAEDIKRPANDFTISVWGETFIHLAGNPWPTVSYVFQHLLRHVSPGFPIRTEARLRAKINKFNADNFAKLEEHERYHPNAPLKTIRHISIKSGGERKGPLSNLAAQISNLNVFAGHFTIGLNITWALIELDRHPECLSKLMTEIDSVNTDNFTEVNSKMPYLDAIMREVSRLHPTTHATLRVINQKTTLQTHNVPATLKPGMLIYMSILHMQTSEKYWGIDTVEFVPERFLDGRDEDKPFMAFGHGPRSCIGHKSDLLVAKVYLITLFKVFEVKVKSHDHEVKLGAIFEIVTPVEVQLTRRI